MGNEHARLGDFNVFLSYSHDDSILVEKIAEKISETGFSCWIDKDKLRAQENFNAAIFDAIDKADVFIAFLSKTYVNKPYCTREFDRAIDKRKSILVACIDDVSEDTNRQSAYMFAFSAGHNILGFGLGIESENDIEAFAKNIASSVPMEYLKRFLESGNSKDYPPISTPDYIIACLRLYHEKQYQQSGNYALSEIRRELFPAIKDTEINIFYKDEEKKNVSLVKYFSDSYNQIKNEKHILITGEGGIGKTVSLLKTCEYLLRKRINAIYVPLSKINENFTLDQYLERVVCGGNKHIWDVLQQLMSAEYVTIPNVILLLDGINEVPLKYIDHFVKGILKTQYISYRGIKLVMTSRWFDNSLMNGLEQNIVSLEMQPLDREAIDSYLQSMNLPIVEDQKVLSVIKTPLMLTLFADVESHKDKYKNIEGIILEDNPDTAGKILSNFFQTQLYRAAGEENFNRGTHLILLEYLLPKIAFTMLNNHSLYIKQDDWKICKRSIKNEEKNFQWYIDDKWSWILRGRSSVNPSSVEPDELLGLAETGLHFLHKTNEGYEFLHQSFRDYFAAYFIANEIWAYREDNKRFNPEESILGVEVYSDEILSLVSDIVREENACPQITNCGYEFPGKNSTLASSKSDVESLLTLWRGKEGETAQNAVANLVNIIKIGRKNVLAWCDFSNLDLRKLWLNRCYFTLWYQDKFYSSIFDEAWIDRANFLTNGHESQISAIAFDGKSKIFSGDKTGTVKIYSLTEHSWDDTIQLQSSAVIDLAWNSNDELLAILYENVVFCYSLKEKNIVSNYINIVKSKSFRYVRFTSENELNVSFDLEPLVWCDTDGKVRLSELPYDVPARCAKWNPSKKEFIRSNMLQLLSVNCFDEGTLSWETHPALKQNKNPQKETKSNEQLYLSLRDVGATGGSVSCIQYNEEGSKVLITIQNLLVEYDTETFEVLNKKIFHSAVQCACYMKNGIAVGAGTNIIFLDFNFAEDYILQGSQTKSIMVISNSYDDNGYYILSSNGELKKLNQELIVQSMRFIVNKSQFAWVRDRLTNKIQMAFLPSEQFQFGARYTYESDIVEPLGWRYEFVDTVSSDGNDDEQQFYNMHASIMLFERTPPYRKIEFTNYTGIWIFGCSFKNIRGDMKTQQNINFLVQNGGITNDYER